MPVRLIPQTNEDNSFKCSITDTIRPFLGLGDRCEIDLGDPIPTPTRPKYASLFYLLLQHQTGHSVSRSR